MTAPAIAQLHAARDRALADPDTNTSAKRAERLRGTVNILERAVADLPPEALHSLAALLDPAIIGHPDEPDTVLGRVAAGQYRTLGTGPLKPSSQRSIMDGLADLNRAAGRPPFWWQTWGARPWAKHTKEPLERGGHLVLRRALSTPMHPQREPYRLRLLLAVELLWATGVTREGLVRADTTDLADDQSSIRLWVNPPGRTEPVVREFKLRRPAQAAVRLWLPVRREVIRRHLQEGPDHPGRQALFITLRHTVAEPANGMPRKIPPGVRIEGGGLEVSYSQWAKWLNSEHEGRAGWPVPTDLYQLARGKAARRRRP